MRSLAYSVFLMLTLASFAHADSSVLFNVTGVVIYPQNGGLILADATVPGGGYYSTVLPPNILRDSIRIDDSGGVRMIRARDEPESRYQGVGGGNKIPVYEILSKQRGKIVSFETARGEYEGMLTWFDESSGFMVLENATYTLSRADTKEPRKAAYLSLQAGEVLSLLLNSRPAMPEPATTTTLEMYNRQDFSRTRVSWESGASTPHPAKLSYMSSGLSWKPQFYLDITGTGGNMTRFSFWAQATNGMGVNLSGIRLRLVAGNINIIQSGYLRDEEWMSMTQNAVGNVYEMRAGSPGIPSTVKVEEYEVYDFPGYADLGAGETQYLPVFNDYVTYEKEYVWDARTSINWYGYSSYDSDDKTGKVQKIYRVKNDGRTWPYGVVSVFENGMLTGQDTISWTPKGSEAKVTVGYAPDIEVKRRETVKAFYSYGHGSDQDYRHTATLKLKNYKTEPAKVLVMDQFPQNAQNFTSSERYDEKPGNLMYWTVELSPGQQKEITYNYITE
ncbi:MAG: DUF4139 domain-containing protein [Candidatus Altiarchaeota archaeon]